MFLYLPLPSLQSNSDIAVSQESPDGKLCGENLPISSSQSAKLVRGENQVNMVFVEGLARISGSSK